MFILQTGSNRIAGTLLLSPSLRREVNGEKRVVVVVVIVDFVISPVNAYGSLIKDDAFKI